MTIIFATALIPLCMVVGLAVDYSFYIEAQAQLNLAADAGAIHAVRIAATDFIQGNTLAYSESDGATAGQQWFAAQAGILPNGTINSVTIPPVAYTATASQFTSTVTYAGTIPTHFGGLFNIPSWPISGTASAVITTNSYVEIDMLMDNSSSMLIGATASDIEKLQNLTICPPTAIASTTLHGDGTSGEYSWNFKNGSTGYTPGSVPNYPPTDTQGSCDPNYDGDPGECISPQALRTPPVAGLSGSLDNAGYCPIGTGTPLATKTAAGTVVLDPNTGLTPNYPSAPCGFACHGANSTTDYWTLEQQANKLGAGIQLRFDVIQSAAAQVVQALINQQQVANQFALGVYTFNSVIASGLPGGVLKVHPALSTAEADTSLAQGQTDIKAIQTPAVIDQANTDFPTAMTWLTNNVTAGGNGNSFTTPRKNLFIITDGLQDYPPVGNRVIGQMTSPTNETVCAPLKAKGFNIYVLYTPYYPLPNPFYLTYAKASVEAPLTDTTHSIAAALQACATAPSQYYSASSPNDINTALQSMLASALAAPGRISQ